jgi:hypothetical protein
VQLRYETDHHEHRAQQEPENGGEAVTKNKLTDLNDHLFAQLERLGEEDLTGDELNREIERARAISGVATQVIANGALALKAAAFADDRMNATGQLPKMLTD